jgi:hypothetical protein
LPEKVQRLGGSRCSVDLRSGSESGTARGAAAGSVMQDLNRTPSMVGLAAIRDGPASLIGI